MKFLQILTLTLFMSGCANAQSTTTTTKLKLSGEPLPAIRHITDMKISGDTLLFVFECEDGYGQRLLRRAIIDNSNNTISISPDMGKREDGYYASYMPYPFISDNGAIHVVGQDDCEIFTVENDTAFVRTRHYLMDSNSTVPFPLSQYVQDVYMTNPDRYVFIGREPNGGRQYAMTSDLTTSKIDTVRQINISPELQTWMPNAGEMVYSSKYNRLAFAYRLHPIIEILDIDGRIINSVKIGKDTFDSKTLEEADFEELNPLHTVDVTYTTDYIYALYWGYRYNDANNTTSLIYKIDWDGNIISRYVNVHAPMYKVTALDDSRLIGWDGDGFVVISNK
ncbi:MAG: TolB-like 6-bladed beta-propeller domain-containing protein [Duncaniella sp.]|nr:TolB-like 6-bladed beta-propeller domain-containing protein [Duncaniella sp.]